jgi:ketosteroid isomerase-like protein
MTNISINAAYGNSAHRQRIIDFNIAFAKGDMDYVLDCFSDDILWDVINHEPVQGKEAVKNLLNEMDDVAEELVIDDIVCDGVRCVASGKLVYADSAIAYSDLYEFTDESESAKIKTLKGYAIELK